MAWHLNLKFLGFVDRGPMYLVVAPVLEKISQICADLNEKLAGRWEFVAACGWASGPEIFRFGGLKAVEDSHGVGFMDLWSSAALTVFDIG